MKKLLKVLAILSMMFYFTGCGVDRGDSLDVAKNYMDAYVDKDVKKVKELSNGNKNNIPDKKISEFEYLRLEAPMSSDNRSVYVFKIEIDSDGKQVTRRMLVETKQNPETKEWYVSRSGIAPIEFK